MLNHLVLSSEFWKSVLSIIFLKVDKELYCYKNAGQFQSTNAHDSF